MRNKADVSVSNHGTLFLFTPISERAKKWVEENVPLESWQWLGNGFSVEHRYAGNLAEGMKRDGLILE